MHAELAPRHGVIDLVDDDDDFRDALSGLLQAAGLAVRAHASAAAYLASAARRGAADPGPGCLLLDVHMPGVTGLELQARLAAGASRQRPIVFLTGGGDIPMTVRALKAGAEDFLTKPVDRDELLAAIARALRRDAAACAADRARAQLEARFARLTPRETQVCERVVAGLLNKQIAHELATTERTVKAHRHQVMDKIGIRSVAELTTLYRQRQGSAGTAPGA